MEVTYRTRGLFLVAMTCQDPGCWDVGDLAGRCGVYNLLSDLLVAVGLLTVFAKYSNYMSNLVSGRRLHDVSRVYPVTSELCKHAIDGWCAVTELQSDLPD